MKKLLIRITTIYPSSEHNFHLSILIFRIALSLQLMIVHGLKKIGIGVEEAEKIPNPVHLPEWLNNLFGISSNLFFPVLVIFGLFTRIAVLPILAVTLSGYFILHWNDPLLVSDMPFMYSLAFLLLFVIGPGKYSIDNSINKKLQT